MRRARPAAGTQARNCFRKLTITARCAGRTVPTTSVGNGCSVARTTAVDTRATGRPATAAAPPLSPDPALPEGRPQPVSATPPDSSATSSPIRRIADAGNRRDRVEGPDPARGVGEHKDSNGFMRRRKEWGWKKRAEKV